MARLRDKFKASPKLESEGVVRDFGYCRITIARAGGSNQKFNAIIERIGKEHQRAIANDLLGAERSRQIMIDAYAQAVILNWETNIGTETEPVWKVGIEPENEGDELLPFNEANVKATFIEMPDLFRECVEVASGLQFFRESLLDNKIKN